MAEIVAPEGSPLAFAVVSSARLEASLAFYVDLIGLDASPETEWRGPVFEKLWDLPPGARARAVMVGAGDSPVGRILLLEFDERALRSRPPRQLILPESHSRGFGLANLNFYDADIRASAPKLESAGYRYWTEPTQHSLEASTGNPVEVVFDGPDGVPINLVELATSDPATRIGQMRAYVERHGRTRTGYTPVVTTSHVVRSMPKARQFYERVLKMGALIDEVMSAERVNRFLRLPEGARTHITFMQGNHMFGKIALSQPLNYAEQCVDLTARARAPNIGYLAQAFEVRRFALAWSACENLGVEVEVSPSRGEIPGIGECEFCLVRNPGSRALQLIYAV